MDYNEERLTAQIKAIVEAGETDYTVEERPLTLDELKELAISMGLTEEQWQNLLVKAEKHLKLADDHLKKQNYNDAILEGEQAIAINPYLNNCNAILAKAYLLKWLDDHQPETREKAEYHARKELVVDPRDQQAVMVLNSIQKKAAVLEQDSSERKKFYILLGVGVVALILLIYFLVSWNNSKKVDEQNNELLHIKNQLIVAEEDVAAKWDLVMVAIDQRNRMIPDLFRAVQTSPPELQTLDSTIKSLQQKIEISNGEERFKLENSLDAKVQEAKNIVKNNVSSSKSIETLLVQIEGCENRIAYEKKNYNDAVKNYNILVKQNADNFPQFPIKPYFNER